MTYPKEQVEFLQCVQDMRQAQQDYYRQPNNYRLSVAKTKERKIDALLQPYIQAGVVTIAKEENCTSQINLF